jgi:hypothetical protein
MAGGTGRVEDAVAHDTRDSNGKKRVGRYNGAKQGGNPSPQNLTRSLFELK